MRTPRAFACLVLLLSGCAASTPAADPAPAAPPPRHLLVLHLNDLADLDGGPSGGGIARAVVAVRRARAGTARAIVTGGGDLLGPSPAALLLGGVWPARGWRALGLDVATPGNRDLALGPEALHLAIRESGARWTAANVHGGAGPQAPCCGMERTVLLDQDGLRVGVAGVVADGATAREADRWGVAVGDPVAAARHAVAGLRAAGAEVVVLLAHGPAPLLELLARAARPDLVLGGHEGTPLALEAGPALVVRTGRGGRDVARVDLLVAPSGAVIARSVGFLPVDPATPPDPVLRSLADAEALALAAAARVQSGTSAVRLDVRLEALGTGEAPMGNLLADLARESLRADAALIDAGSAAANRRLEPGPLPDGLPLALFPDLAPLVALDLTGRKLRATLEHGLAALPEAAPRFLQVSGLRVVYDPGAPPGERIRSVTVGGDPLDASRHYRIAATSRLARGAGGHAWLRGAPRIVPEEAGPLLAALLVARLRQRAPLAPRVEGRLIAIGHGPEHGGGPAFRTVPTAGDPVRRAADAGAPDAGIRRAARPGEGRRAPSAASDRSTSTSAASSRPPRPRR